jgi:hypothetical protein
MDAGYNLTHARELPENRYVDLHRALDLVRRGCAVETAFQILS